jgi:hypothetical protein
MFCTGCRVLVRSSSSSSSSCVLRLRLASYVLVSCVLVLWLMLSPLFLLSLACLDFVFFYLLSLVLFCQVQNVFVVVSRWFGGVLLGPDRFKVTRQDKIREDNAL